MATYSQELTVSPAIPHSDFQYGCVPKAVAAKATRWPDALALTAGSDVLTYQELDCRANRLAQHLRFLGVGTDVLVGLCLPRSLDMVVGALGILKAGGAYVPMDPSYPPDRLAFMVGDARAPVLVTNESFAPRASSSACEIVDIGSPLVAKRSDVAPRIEIMPEDLAYVIYTSGSTGTPKGVEITHGGLANLVSWHRQVFRVTAEDRAGHVASLGFDAAVWELWPYLAAGASVHLADDATRSSAELLRDWLVSCKITISFVPTPIAEQLLAFEWPRQAVLRTLLTGGDTLHRYPPSNLPFKLVNNYGPTECTVVATSTTVLPDPQAQTPPIGRAIANTDIYLLDEHLRRVPAGEPGEIHIGGPGLARGYHNHAELTATKFIRNPFGSDPCARLYKTGDLGCELSDGQIAFLGRIDDQIKIRGYRIEPNEIVSVLNRHPDVRESLVVAREDTPGDKRLVAYLVLSTGSNATFTGLREFLSSLLPEYMLPAAFVPLTAFPLTPHGKIDRSALPEPTAQNMLCNDLASAPRSPVEERVAGILTALLGIEAIGAEDNFFQMGGHSLLGAQMIARIRDSFGVELSLRTLFDHPTLGEMSSEIERLILEKLASAQVDAQNAPPCTNNGTL